MKWNVGVWGTYSVWLILLTDDLKGLCWGFFIRWKVKSYFKIYLLALVSRSFSMLICICLLGLLLSLCHYWFYLWLPCKLLLIYGLPLCSPDCVLFTACNDWCDEFLQASSYLLITSACLFSFISVKLQMMRFSVGSQGVSSWIECVLTVRWPMWQALDKA